jgi:hypothetical protein
MNFTREDRFCFPQSHPDRCMSAEFVASSWRSVCRTVIRFQRSFQLFVSAWQDKYYLKLLSRRIIPPVGWAVLCVRYPRNGDFDFCWALTNDVMMLWGRSLVDVLDAVQQDRSEDSSVGIPTTYTATTAPLHHKLIESPHIAKIT